MSAVLAESPGKAINSSRWEYIRLGDICRTTSGGTPSRKRSDYFHGDIPWVKSGELPDGFVGNIEECISEEALKESNAKLFPAGTLLIALYGATVGKLGILTRPAATNQAVCAIFPPTSLDTRFLFWHLRFRRHDLVARAVGGAQPNISQAVIRSLVVPVPPFDRQHEIVAEIEKQFSRVDEAVANLRRVKANLKRYKAALLKDAVDGRLVPTEAYLARCQGRIYETGTQLLQRILETRRSHWKGKGKYKEPAAPDTTALPALPEGWVWANVDQLAVLVTDGDHNPPRRTAIGVPHLTAKHVRGWRLEPNACTFISRDDANRVFKRYLPRAGDVIVTCVGTVGRTAIVPEAFEFSPDRNLAAVRVLPNSVGASFLQLVLESPEYQKLMRGASGSTAQPHLYLGDLRALLIPLPPLLEQHRIAADVDRRLSLIHGVEAEVDANLKRGWSLRSSVLQAAFKLGGVKGQIVQP